MSSGTLELELQSRGYIWMHSPELACPKSIRNCYSIVASLKCKGFLPNCTLSPPNEIPKSTIHKPYHSLGYRNRGQSKGQLSLKRQRLIRPLILWLMLLKQGHCKIVRPRVDDLYDVGYIDHVYATQVYSSGRTYRFVHIRNRANKPYLLFLHGFPESS